MSAPLEPAEVRVMRAISERGTLANRGWVRILSFTHQELMVALDLVERGLVRRSTDGTFCLRLSADGIDALASITAR